MAKFRGDMGVSFATMEALRAADHDAIHLRDGGLIRLPDRMIAAKAVAESRVVLALIWISGIFSRLQAARARASSSSDCEIRHPPP
jgi:hypothetical protein